MSSERLRYAWRWSVRDAILETDPERQLAKIISAEGSISETLFHEDADPDEQLALQYALCGLKVLQLRKE